MIVRPDPTARLPSNRKDGEIVVRLFVKQMQAETLFGVGLAIPVPEPPRISGEPEGQRLDPVGDRADVALLGHDGTEIVNIVLDCLPGHFVPLSIVRTIA